MSDAIEDDERRTPEWTRGDRLRKARELAGLNQEQMGAQLANLNKGTPFKHSTIAAWERDLSQPRNLMAVIEQWSKITGVEVAWLLAITHKADNPRYVNVRGVTTHLGQRRLFDPDVPFGKAASVPRPLELVKA